MAAKAVLIQVDTGTWAQVKRRASALSISPSQLMEDAANAYLGGAKAPAITQAVQRLTEAVHDVALVTTSNYAASTPTAGTSVPGGTIPKRRK